ncbi:unnamed protein product [Ceutorhynchus assimilis]|uniref:Uncharacterized protein n=1 Tax=Ceutorhynchus assimilis TaxID=467358 RepID=A0A9N9MDT2_9CUCU|nr:unnamed protein product [Ceutorhynchus assimilis]
MKCFPICFNCRGASCFHTLDEIDDEPNFNEDEVLLPDEDDVLEDLQDEDDLKLDQLFPSASTFHSQT